MSLNTPDTFTNQAYSIRLRTIDQSDIPFLYDLCTRESSASSFRFRGSTPDFRTFSNSLWEGILSQYVVADLHTGARLGLVCLYNASIRDGWAYVGAFTSDSALSSGRVVKAVDLLCTFAFQQWPFRKLYVEATDDTLVQFGHILNTYFEEVATINDHVFHGGRYQSLHFFAASRSVWEERVSGRHAILGLQEQMYDESRADESALTEDGFLEFVASVLSLKVPLELDNELVEDVGLDSLDIMVLEDAILDRLFPRSLQLPEYVTTVRDLYLWYCEGESRPVEAVR